MKNHDCVYNRQGRCTECSRERTEAKRLAAAAPELLRASKALILFLETPMNLRAEDELKGIVLNLHQAIKKAEGK